MNENEEIELTPLQRVTGNIVAGALIVLCGLFLLLVGVKVIPLKFADVAPAACLFAVGLTLLVTAFIQRNTVSLWLSFAFNVPAVISLFAAYTSFGYGNLYPFYIAIPAIASLFTLFLSTSKAEHVKVVLFFGMLAFLFALNSLMHVGWGIVIPLLVVFAGLLILYVAVCSVWRDKKEKNERE